VLTNTDTIVKALGGTGAAEAVVAILVAAVWVSLVVWSVKQERASRRLTRELDETAVPV
jgi:hypothetical protein